MKNIKTEEAKLRGEIERIDKLKEDMTSECWVNSRIRINRFKAEAKLQQFLADKEMFQDAVEEIREKLADLEHEQWMSWSKYVRANNVIPFDLLKKWEKNWKPYSELDEKTKDSDRIWADKIIKELLKTLGVEEE